MKLLYRIGGCRNSKSRMIWIGLPFLPSISASTSLRAREATKR